jgi:DASH complex subunit DAD2
MESTAIALVMANWHNVLRAINMASCESSSIPQSGSTSASRERSTNHYHPFPAKLPKPQNDADAAAALPQTLVRIPTEHAPALQAQAEAAKEANE